MSVAKTYSAQLTGLISHRITIEVDISHGLHSFSVVGLGDRAIEESKDRISAAIKNSGFTSPKQKNEKVIISLAPADIHKAGPSFDLAMALAYLAATGEIPVIHEQILFLGELSLDGHIKRIGGILPMLYQAHAQGFTQAFIPKSNEKEASLAQDIEVYAVSSINEVIHHLDGTQRAELVPHIQPSDTVSRTDTAPDPDMRTIRGNETAKRGLEIAAAGAHNLIMCGPPGTGKTMLARSFRTILPTLSYEHAVEVTSIYSAAHLLDDHLMMHPPFRAPHHTASYPSMIGGGSIPKPGEVTLAHRGVLFLDEFPEFDRSVIEALRQPLEDRSITISRARGVMTFPAQCILVASMNPCPCGLGKERGCSCPDHIFKAYRRRLSGPIMDRIDVWTSITQIDYDKLSTHTHQTETSQDIQKRIIIARKIQKRRFATRTIPISYNSEMNPQDIDTYVIMDDAARTILRSSAEKMSISGRAFHRTIKVAQTIADLSGYDTIRAECILEALQYREKLTK